MTLPRGFQANAEREATRLRKELGLEPSAQLDRARLDELERLHAFAFPAATSEVRGNSYVVTNPLRSVGRIFSEIAHELSTSSTSTPLRCGSRTSTR